MVTHLSDPLNSVFLYDEGHKTCTIIRESATFEKWESKVTTECAQVSWRYRMSGEWWLGLVKPHTVPGYATSASGRCWLYTESLLELLGNCRLCLSVSWFAEVLVSSLFSWPWFMDLSNSSVLPLFTAFIILKNLIFSFHACGWNLCGNLSSNRALFFDGVI